MATSSEVCLRSGASFRQLDHWVRRQYVRPVGDSSGSGSSRDFSPAEALIACQMMKLIRLGFTVEAAARYAREGTGWLRLDDTTRLDQVKLLAMFLPEFDWDDFGLDEVKMAEHHDWAVTLAEQIVLKLRLSVTR